MRPLTVEDAREMVLALQDEIRRSEQARYDHRLHGVLLVAQGMSAPKVARLLGDGVRTVEYWVERFNNDGLAGLVEGERPGRPSKLSIEQLQELEVILRASPREQGVSANLWDGKTLSHWIRQQWGVHLGTRQCQRLFRTLGFRLRKPRPMVGHADPDLQRTHKKLQALARDPSTDLWALDEVHFQQHGSRCRMWVPAELKDPILLHAPTRKSVGYFGAVRLRDGKLLTRQERKVFDALTFWQFLKQLRQVNARSGRRVIVISDNAKYHHALLHKSWREQAEPQFALHFLPPYCPQLNPIERVWKLTRRLCLHNVYFANLQHVTDCVDEQFQSWKTPNGTLRKLCAFN